MLFKKKLSPIFVTEVDSRQLYSLSVTIKQKQQTQKKISMILQKIASKDHLIVNIGLI
jgi:hypothetical protein